MTSNEMSLMANIVVDMQKNEANEVLDKIKAEIMDTGAYEQEVNGKTEFLKGINYCLGVMNKYKMKSEEMRNKT